MSFKIVKTFSLLIARSTWIRTLATLRVLVTSSFDSCLPCEKAEMFNLTRNGNSKSWMVKPVSAMTSSPGTNLFRMPQSCTIHMSLARPPYALEMCMMSPLGAIETQYCVIRFIVTIRLSLRLQIARLLHDCLCAVQDTCGIRIPLETRWHCCFNYFPWKPHYQISQMNG